MAQVVITDEYDEVEYYCINKSMLVFCREHPAVEITLFCLTCDNLICTECTAKKHKRHNITTPDEIKDKKIAELNKNIRALQEKQILYQRAIENEQVIHSRFSKSIDQVRIDISDQKAKITEELNRLCNEQFGKVSELQQKEEEQYSAACDEMEVKKQGLSFKELIAQKRLDSNDAILIIQATKNTSQALGELEEPTMSQRRTASYQTNDRSQTKINQVMGKINVDLGTKLKFKFPARLQKKTLHAKKTSDDKQQIKHDGDTQCTDPAKVRIKSSIIVKDKQSSLISVIVPLQDKVAWVAALGCNYMSLIDSTGDIITQSVPLDGHVYDAKEYKNGLLATCENCCKIFKMSLDGKTILIFSDLSPYCAKGLCVTHEMDVVACMRSPVYANDNKVIRLGKDGEIKQTIQCNVAATLYCDPSYVTVFTTGEIIVVDWSEPHRIVGIDNKGRHLFTWEGEMEGRKIRDYNINNITRDSKNNVFVTDCWIDRVFVLGKNKSEATCLLENTQGMYSPDENSIENDMANLMCPRGIAVDNEGLLWIGCDGGKIHIIE